MREVCAAAEADGTIGLLRASLLNLEHLDEDGRSEGSEGEIVSKFCDCLRQIQETFDAIESALEDMCACSRSEENFRKACQSLRQIHTEDVKELEAAATQLLQLAKGMIPTQHETSAVQQVLKQCLSSPDAPKGNPAGFNLMRLEVLERFKGEQVWVTVGPGVRLDCCYLPPRGGRTDTAAPQKCVIICNPNAGFYETLSLSSQGGSDWASFYRSLGCSVFLHNYRGFGRSTGSPSPAVLAQDLDMLIRYLRTDRGIESIALHGESIGGMVAAAGAARAPEGLISLVVIDRSFSSLSAAAQRLMGAWTGPAIKLFTGWTTNVPAWLHTAKCHKIIACDPRDAVISDAASTKAGVAIFAELGPQASYAPPEIPRSYAVADHLQDEPPAAQQHPGNNGAGLSEEVLLHWAACLRHIAYRGSLRRRRKVVPTSRGGGDIEMVSVSGHFSDDEQDDDEQDGEEEEESGRETQSIRVRIDTSVPMGELWSILSRIDGLAGMDLGSAVASGFDSVRAWTCTLVTWAGRVKPPQGVSRVAVPLLSLSQARNGVNELLSRFPDDLGSHASVLYVAEMLEFLCGRVGSLAVLCSVTSGIGTLIPLTCGHNSPYSEGERAALLSALEDLGWISI